VLSAWRRSISAPKEKEAAQPNPELINIWRGASVEDRRAALDAGGGTQLLEDLSPALREFLQQRLANPHAVNRLAEKAAEEEQAVEVAGKAADRRAPRLGNATTYDAPKKVKRDTAEAAKPKNVGLWRKFSREKLQAVYDQERERMVVEHLNPAELKRLEAMRGRLAAFKETEAAVARQGNGSDPSETAKVRMAENAKRFTEEPEALAA
jgi:hypothetical protein